MRCFSDDLAVRLLTIGLIFFLGIGFGMVIQKKFGSSYLGIALNQTNGVANASKEINEVRVDLDSPATPLKFVDESPQSKLNTDYLISVENAAQESPEAEEPAIIELGDLWYDAYDPALMVVSEKNLGEAGFDPESAAQTFVPQLIKNVGEAVFDPESAEQTFVPQLIKNVGEAVFDPESAEREFAPKRIQNLGSPVYDVEAALVKATPDGVIIETGTTALDAETRADAAGRG